MKITTKQLRQLIREVVQDGVGIGAHPSVRKCLEAYDLLTFEERQYVLNVVQVDINHGPDKEPGASLPVPKLPGEEF